MQIQNEHHSFTGMQRDLSPSKHPTSFLYDAKNVRLTPREGDTMFAITNEKGTLKTDVSLKGNYLGHCLLNNYLIVFTHITPNISDNSNLQNEKEGPDFIYRIDLDTLEVITLKTGNYSFSELITAVGSYENENIQKVYWTDGVNQPRIINIVDTIEVNGSTVGSDKDIDFLPTLALNEGVSITKFLGTGEFPAGVIQYAFTYYNRHLQESSIFYVTPLQYISYAGRAGSPEDKIATAFKIDISNVDTKFDYLRIYSILRTSLDGTPVVKRVQDIPISHSNRENIVNSNSNTTNNEPENTFIETIYYSSVFPTKLEVSVSTDGGVTYNDAEDWIYSPKEGETIKDHDTAVNLAKEVEGAKWYRFGPEYNGSQLIVKLSKDGVAVGEYSCQNTDSQYIDVVISDYSVYNTDSEELKGYTFIAGDNPDEEHIYGKLLFKKGTPPNKYTYMDTPENIWSQTSSSYSKQYRIFNNVHNIQISLDGFTFFNIDGFKSNDDMSYIQEDMGALYEHIIEDEKSLYKIKIAQSHQIVLVINNTYYSPRVWDVFDESYNAEFVILKYPNSNTYSISYYMYDKSLLNPIYKPYPISVIESKSEQDTPSGVSVTFIDDGTKGDTIDPTELLYKGGNIVKAKNLIIKDNTLFLGNIELDTPFLDIGAKLLEYNGISFDNPLITSDVINSIAEERTYPVNKLYDDEDEGYDAKYDTEFLDSLNSNTSSPLAFKFQEYYRLGIQFQHESGKWSEPYWLGDVQCNANPMKNINAHKLQVVNVPIFKYTLDDFNILNTLISNGYKKARGLFIPPNYIDRTILCQGAVCPTVYRNSDRYNGSDKPTGNLYAQPSWIFRPNTKDYVYTTHGVDIFTGDAATYGHDKFLNSHFSTPFTTAENSSAGTYVNTTAPYFHSTEIMGKYSDNDRFKLDHNLLTFHSPDILFDDSFSSMDFSQCEVWQVGHVKAHYNYSDISLQTSSTTISGESNGFTRPTNKAEGYKTWMAEWCYEDRIVDDSAADKYEPWKENNTEIDTCLWPVFMWHKNGSLNNDVNRTGRSAELLKKKISNYKIAGYTRLYNSSYRKKLEAEDIKLFESDQLSLITVDGKPYLGNIETLLIPEYSSYYFRGKGRSPWEMKLWAVGTEKYLKNNSTSDTKGIWGLGNTDWERFIVMQNILHEEPSIGDHIPSLTKWNEGVSMKYKSTPHLVIKLKSTPSFPNEQGSIPIFEIRKAYNKDTMYGGATQEALCSRAWIPCGPPVSIPTILDESSKLVVKFLWGDTYYQRYDCLKTYAFTPEDKNQVVDILSFVCETRVNIDGRYDRNKGQHSNLNVSPINYNLINKVYSQLDTFFSYRMLDLGQKRTDRFPNQITWSKEKHFGADVDACTNITLASTYDLDGSCGEINSLNVWNDKIYCFQNSGISNILFNSRVQIPTSDNVPIEISNSYKVDGYRYISTNIGCDSTQKIKETESGIYFIDSNNHKLFNINTSISDVTTTHNMTSWFNQEGKNITKLLYDNLHNDLYIMTPDTTLCFSEILGQFTSFMDYQGIDLLENHKDSVFSFKDSKMYKLFEGDYNYFFDSPKPWNFTFISNGVDNSLSDFDKIFSNIDYRLDIKDSSNYNHDKSLDYIKVENEYQDTGEVSLINRKIINEKVTYSSSDTNLKKKFRIWRIQIPRDKTHKMDRIRNPWCKITLGSNDTTNSQAVLHNLNVQYYV